MSKSTLKRLAIQSPIPDFTDRRGRTWEAFLDPSYYDCICVRPKSEKSFDSPLAFHFDTSEQALAFIELLKVSS